MLDPQSEAIRRLRSLQDQYGERLNPNYSGSTGLQRNDAQGWSDMMNAQTEAANIQRELEGKGPLNVEESGVVLPSPGASPPVPFQVETPSNENVNAEIRQRMYRPINALRGVR